MNKENIIRSTRYQLVAEMVGKEKNTVRQAFQRAGFDIMSIENINSYLLACKSRKYTKREV